MLEGEDGGGEMEWLGERMERVRWDDGEEIEMEKKGGCWEWIEADGEWKRKLLERTWVS